MNDIEILIDWIKNDKKIVFFGGAGVSTESGLKDFRSKDGLYNEKYNFPPEEILSHDFFYNRTKDFYDFYKKKLNTKDFHPNITHYTLKKMQDKNKLSSIITQNIDGFHQEAGSTNVLELHGSIKRNYCINCHAFYDDNYVFSDNEIPKCHCGGIIKPDVVLYDEALDNDILIDAVNEIKNADLLIIAGTSLNVYPAAGLINYFQGDHLVLINRDTTPYDNRCNLIIHDNLGNVFSKINEKI